MANITLSIPSDIYLLMKKHSEVRWTEIMRNAAIQRLRELEDKKIQQEALDYASKDWDDAHDLFKF